MALGALRDSINKFMRLCERSHQMVWWERLHYSNLTDLRTLSEPCELGIVEQIHTLCELYIPVHSNDNEHKSGDSD